MASGYTVGKTLLVEHRLSLFLSVTKDDRSTKIGFTNCESCICDAPPQMELDHLPPFHVYRASVRGVSGECQSQKNEVLFDGQQPAPS